MSRLDPATAVGDLIPSNALATASLDRLDAVASAMERKWGIDRLPKLVDAPLAVRFRSQAERLDEAIRSGVSAAVSAQAEAMLRAWHAVDAAALAAGWKPLSPTIWETVLPETGEVVAIVRDADEAFDKSATGIALRAAVMPAPSDGSAAWHALACAPARYPRRGY